MFTSIIDSFLRSGPATLEQKMLNLELLVYSFHEVAESEAPSFCVFERAIEGGPRARRVCRATRGQVADEVTRKQMLVIEKGGARFDATIDTKTLGFPAPAGRRVVPLLPVTSPWKASAATWSSRSSQRTPRREQLPVRTTLRTLEGGRTQASSTEFWVGHFDFPMIDNTRLPHDQRLAVVLNNFDPKRGAADVTVVCFRAKYAALREKPYYEEVLAKLLAANRASAATEAPLPLRPPVRSSIPG